MRSVALACALMLALTAAPVMAQLYPKPAGNHVADAQTPPPAAQGAELTSETPDGSNAEPGEDPSVSGTETTSTVTSTTDTTTTDTTTTDTPTTGTPATDAAVDETTATVAAPDAPSNASKPAGAPKLVATRENGEAVPNEVGSNGTPPPAEAVEQAPSDVVPRVTGALESETVVVGQPVVLRIKILVPTWLPKPPSFPSVDAPNVIVRLPERASGPISETIEGETWSGVGRAYRLYPMVPGEVVLPEQVVGVTWADPDTTEPRTYEATLVAQRFTATVPAGAEGLDPLILADAFTLEQQVEGGEGTLGQGDAVRRSVTATISGMSSLFIPPLLPPIEDDERGQAVLRAYPAEPVISETEESGVLSGKRSEAGRYIAQYGGEAVLPAISIDWFNLSSGRVETAVLEAVTITVEAPAAPIASRISPRQVAVLIAGGALLALLAWLLWRFVLPPIRQARARRHAAWLASEERAAGDVEAAFAAQDLSGVLTTLALWTARCPGPETALEGPLAAVGASRYGRKAGVADTAAWQALRKAFRSERKRRLSGDVLSALPPLNPA